VRIRKKQTDTSKTKANPRKIKTNQSARFSSTQTEKLNERFGPKVPITLKILTKITNAKIIRSEASGYAIHSVKEHHLFNQRRATKLQMHRIKYFPQNMRQSSFHARQRNTEKPPPKRIALCLQNCDTPGLFHEKFAVE
jgi:hypothetical protein